MKYLVDADVLGEATRTDPNPHVISWLRTNERELAVNAVIVGEIRYGILLLPRGRRRRKLEAWFDEGVRNIDCLGWDMDTGLRWAQLCAALRAGGRAMPVKDSLIAASALQHDLALVTRNVRDFAAAGLEMIDPFR